MCQAMVVELGVLDERADSKPPGGGEITLQDITNKVSTKSYKKSDLN